MKQFAGFVALFLVLLIGCSTPASPAPRPTTTLESWLSTPMDVAELLPAATATATSTRLPTSTPLPSELWICVDLATRNPTLPYRSYSRCRAAADRYPASDDPPHTDSCAKCHSGPGGR